MGFKEKENEEKEDEQLFRCKEKRLFSGSTFLFDKDIFWLEDKKKNVCDGTTLLLKNKS